MAKQTIGIGTVANDGTGDSLRDAGTKINANFTELYNAGQIQVVFNGGGSVIQVGTQCEVRVRHACTIVGAILLADVSGSIVIDVWKDTYANYPPTVADTITASAKPTLSSAIKSTDSTLTGWTTSVAAGDVLKFNVDSVTTCKRANLILEVNRT